ncbi:ABC transporter permease [Marivirga lumbricoides]|uniref:ABC transporter permease n=1 Tax=Marivirga lumbricoides TaxID=1046115 RepID=A0ABQ1LVT6_9BACT|nr:ABC transporter permease [Marivirga lumbricoides]
MLQNYIKIALRNIKRYPLRHFIHVFGLSIGITVCVVVFKLISFENNFDTFHQDADQIYRVNTMVDYGKKVASNPGTPQPLNEALKNEFPSIEITAPVYHAGKMIVRSGDGAKNLGASDFVSYVDNGYFEIFNYEWLAGDSSSALDQPNAVVLTVHSAKKYFGEQPLHQIIGNELLYGDTIQTIVKGVVVDLAKQSDLVFTDFISYSTVFGKYDADNANNWAGLSTQSQMFVKLFPEQEEAAREGLKAAHQKYVSADIDWIKGFNLEPLREVHFSSTYNGHVGDKRTLKGLMIIGFLILIIACVNFINLETAQAQLKSKEVGIRKSLGSSRKQLIGQFLMATYLIIVLAILSGILLSHLVVIYFQNLLPAGFDMSFFAMENLVFLLALSLLVLFFCGIYPALVISKYSPVKAIKSGKYQKFDINYFLRKNLIVIQFGFSIAFIIVVLAIKSQMDFLMNKDLGFEKEAIVYIETPYDADFNKNSSLKNELLTVPGVEEVSLSFDALMSGSLIIGSVAYEINGELEELDLQMKMSDTSYLPLHDVPLLAGRYFRNNKQEVILNAAALTKLGIDSPSEAIGNSLKYRDSDLLIVGVIDDIHTRSMYEAVKPTMFTYSETVYNVNVKLASEVNLATTLENLQESYKKIYPNEANDFQFLDEAVANFFKNEIRLRKILFFATALAIFLSALGLFGLVSFTISQRLKEISIRKILGATIADILVMVSKEYAMLIGISFLLAIYPAWYFLSDWFSNFHYRISMPVGIYLLSGIIALLLCLCIVLIHSFSAANANPAEVLKDE